MTISCQLKGEVAVATADLQDRLRRMGKYAFHELIGIERTQFNHGNTSPLEPFALIEFWASSGIARISTCRLCFVSWWSSLHPRFLTAGLPVLAACSRMAMSDAEALGRALRDLRALAAHTPLQGVIWRNFCQGRG